MGVSRQKRNRIKIILLLSVLNIFLIITFTFGFISKENFSNNTYDELEEITGKESFETIKEYFISLAYEKGAPYAYEILKRATLAPGTDTHLMGHFVGEILYEQEGADGMRHCTDDFRNACSHTIVVGLFSEKGVGALSEIAAACKKAPGGKGAYNICFHGLGHGVLAFVGYDLEKAVEICMSIKQNRVDGREASECVGGTIMEIVGGGDHDKATWFTMREKYLGGEDPLFPCNSDMIPKNSKGMCYAYLTPHLFEFGGGNLNNPTAEDFARGFRYCDILLENDPNRRNCYGNFGKEFVVLANKRDIRNVTEISNDQLKQVEEWCQLAEIGEAIDYCIMSSVDSLYWGGENDRQAALRLCDVVEDDGQKNACYSHLIEIVNFYIDEVNYKKEFCREVPDKFNRQCILTTGI